MIVHVQKAFIKFYLFLFTVKMQRAKGQTVENDDYLESMENNRLDGTNGSLNMTDNNLSVSIFTYVLID